ncbi:MAG: Maf family protein [bacterium]
MHNAQPSAQYNMLDHLGENYTNEVIIILKIPYDINRTARMNQTNQAGQADKTTQADQTTQTTQADRATQADLADQTSRAGRINRHLDENFPGEHFPLLLASASPRRKELLHLLGLKFEVIPSQVEENDVPGLPEEKARTWALLKAEAVAGRRRSGIIIGADTIVVLDGKVLGKPRDEQDAREMLGLLSGNTHTVITGLAVIDTRSGRRILESVESKVSFRTLSKDEIDDYIVSQEPMDKAGAYGIQGTGARFVTQVKGCYTNIVGLPVTCLLESLERILDLPSLTYKDNQV